MPRVLSIALLLTGITLAGEPAATPRPVPATILSTKAGPLSTVAAEITKQTNIPIDLSGVDAKAVIPDRFDRQSFWTVLEKLADRSGSRIVLESAAVRFVKRADGMKPAASTVDGPFRIVVKKVVSTKDFDTGLNEYQVHLEVQWEPRFPVYLIDSEPAVKSASAAGKPLAAEAPTGRVLPTGYFHPAVVRFSSMPRGATKIDSLSGSFRVVAAEKFLSVEFADLTGDKPVSQTVDGVKVTMKPIRKLEKRAELGFELEYPPSHPEFESFQLWAGMNKLKLIGPDNRTTLTPSDFSTDENGRRVRADYNFSHPNGQAFSLPNLKGWRAVYQTPCPMVEQTVTFTLKDIELP